MRWVKRLINSPTGRNARYLTGGPLAAQNAIPSAPHARQTTIKRPFQLTKPIFYRSSSKNTAPIQKPNEKTFYETVKSILNAKAMVSSLEPSCALEIRDLHYFTNTLEVEQMITSDYLDGSNLKVRQRVNLSIAKK